MLSPALWLAVLWGCASPAAPQHPALEEVVLVPSDPNLQWTVSRSADGKSLQIDYTATNASDQPIYLCDKLITHKAGGYQVTDRAVVLQVSPQEVVVAKGQLSPDAPVAQLTPAQFTKVAAHQSVNDRVVIALPLQTWHPDGRTNPLQPGVTHVQFAIATIHGEPTDWTELDAGGGAVLRVPDHYDESWLKGGTQALPEVSP